MDIKYIDGEMLKKCFLVAASTLEKNKEIVNSLNVFPVPDGDTGTNMSLTIQSAAKQVRSLKSTNLTEIGNAIANGSLMGARGNSGVILSQLLRGLSNGMKDKDKLNTKDLSEAFTYAKETAYKAVMKPIEGTILTVARECAEKASEIYETQTDVIKFLGEVIDQGEIALNKTPDMLDVLKQAGVVDAGGKGLIYLLKGALNALNGNEEIIIEDPVEADIKEIHVSHDTGEYIEFGYCTEFIINKAKANINEFREYITKYGDSILVVGSEDIIKVHIHTNTPGTVLQDALEIGELIDIKIDNMRYQHSSKIIEDDLHKNIKEETKKYSFIAISMGVGIENVFKDLKVDYVIAGGQTMNPSTEDILKAIDEVNGENVIILPNNSNIILAANQAKELSERNIEVVPTKTIPQGIAALLTFNEENDVDVNVNEMIAAAKEIKTGQITYAVRDTKIDDIEIKKDNIMGICDSNIMTVGKDIDEVAIDLLKKIATDDSDLVTIFYGEDISEESATSLAEKIENELEDCDVEVVYGGQPIYYYLFSVE